MIEAKYQGASAFMASAAATLGFVAPWPEVVAGYCFAVAGGFAGMVASPPAERMGVMLTILVALVIASFAGMMHPHFAQGWPLLGIVSALPVQLVMGVSGLASRSVARRVAAGDLSLPWRSKGGTK